MSIEIRIPKKDPTKIGSAKLQSVRRVTPADLSEFSPEDDPVWYTVKLNSFEHDFIFTKGRQHDRLYVLLSGYADRERLQPPVFQRWSWASSFPGHCLYISDPTLKLSSEVGLAWYAGTHELDVLPEVAEIIRTVAGKLGLEDRNVTLYASSGGGFAALKLLHSIPDATAVVINPQTEITRYNTRHVDIYLNNFLEGLSREEALARYPHKLSLLPDAAFLSTRRIVYAQNLRDGHHVRNHFKPFCEGAGIATDDSVLAGNFRTVLFENAGGHAKGEPPELLPTLLENAWEVQQIDLPTA